MEIISTISTIEEVKEIEHLFQDRATISYEIEKCNTTLPFILYSVENENKDGDDYFIFDESCLDLLDDIVLNEEKLQILVEKFKELK